MLPGESAKVIRVAGGDDAAEEPPPVQFAAYRGGHERAHVVVRNRPKVLHEVIRKADGELGHVLNPTRVGTIELPLSGAGPAAGRRAISGVFHAGNGP